MPNFYDQRSTMRDLDVQISMRKLLYKIYMAILHHRKLLILACRNKIITMSSVSVFELVFHGIIVLGSQCLRIVDYFYVIRYLKVSQQLLLEIFIAWLLIILGRTNEVL